MQAHKLTNRLLIGRNVSFISRLTRFAMTLILLLAITLPGMAEDQVFTPTRAQKGVRTSTDVIAVTLPATALAVTLIERDWEGLKEGALSAAVTTGVTLGLKYLVKEQRPDFSNRHSFPSGHSAVTFASATYIGRRYGWKWSIPAYALSTYTAWGRVYGRKHHWWDVAAGAAIGAASTMLFTHPYMQKHEAVLVPAVTDTSAGVIMSFTF
ncbi:MAG: phosphatase PAP2 family protein [Muribaculaceae bacterium]|nr:phosphatase PAP2 family protein [Muribaculaceae bacterium]MDE6552551.1 phosphatase PAP2 family protein [Muribaculaceae bacterium]